MRIKDKIALITGGARGIGAATAELFCQHGATVIIADILDTVGQALADKLGQKANYFHLDVANEQEWQNLSRYIEQQYGQIDILFNNAGITGLDDAVVPHDPEHTEYDNWRKVHRINLDGVFLGCKYGIQLMKKHGGSIINMSSRSGMVGVPAAAAYASSKAAVRNHTKSVALYCAEKKYQIRCNSVHPGAILTPIWEPMLGNDEQSREQAITTIASGIPLGKMGEAIDVAYAVLYFASEESKYITGSELTIDGGILAGSAASVNVSEE